MRKKQSCQIKNSVKKLKLEIMSGKKLWKQMNKGVMVPFKLKYFMLTNC